MTSLKDKQQKVLKGKYGKQNSLHKQVKPFSKLSKEELKEELTSRNILTNETTKKGLENLLNKELKGTQRVPVILIDKPLAEMKEINLEKYEVVSTEPMHDIGGHVSNIFEELPYHISKEDKGFLLTSSVLIMKIERSKEIVINVNHCLW